LDNHFTNDSHTDIVCPATNPFSEGEFMNSPTLKLTSRNGMTGLLCLAMLLAAHFADNSLLQAEETARSQQADGPNIVLIFVDDLGYADIGPFGSDNRTPHLDRMAREGRKLTSHYAAPVCSPSRAALLTG